MSSKLITFVVYNEPNFDDHMKLGLPFVVSPCHDKDVDKKTGELKKPHWHCIVRFNSRKTCEQALCYLSPVFGIKYCENVMSTDGIRAYLTHENNPNKAQYSRDDISYYGTNEIDFFGNEKITLADVIRTIDFVNEHLEELNYNSLNFGTFCRALVYFNDMELLNFVTRHAYAVKSLFNY